MTVSAGLIVASHAGALGAVTFTGTNAASDLGASATFSLLGGGQLQVTLENTYSGDTADQSHILTGVFFAGANGLTPVSATAAAGSLEWIGSSSSTPESSTVLGTEWAYSSGASAPGDGTAGIVSSGYYTPGSGNFASPGDMLDGSAYGIISKGYAGSDGDGLDDRQYIQDEMIFVLSGFTGSLSGISDVSFQYGTMLSEPSLTDVAEVTPTPEPEALIPISLVAAVVWMGCRRRFSQAATV
jgi:hypothetical protein